MKMEANFLYKPSSFQMEDCEIERILELSYEDFCDLKRNPLRDWSFIIENRDCMFCEDGVTHCLLVLGENSNEGILIEAKGYSYPRYAAYIPRMRDIINAEMDRAADYIIRQGIENTYSGSWCVYFPDLKEHLGLTIREGGGFEKLLLDAFFRRQEVADGEIIRDCISMSYHPEYCLRMDAEGMEEQDELDMVNRQMPGNEMQML